MRRLDNSKCRVQASITHHPSSSGGIWRLVSPAGKDLPPPPVGLPTAAGLVIQSAASATMAVRPGGHAGRFLRTHLPRRRIQSQRARAQGIGAAVRRSQSDALQGHQCRGKGVPAIQIRGTVLSCAHVGNCARAVAEVIAITAMNPNEKTHTRFMALPPGGSLDVSLKDLTGLLHNVVRASSDRWRDILQPT